MNGVRNMLSSLTPPRERVTSVFEIPRSHSTPDLVGDDVYVRIIDKLREFGVSDLVSLPQLVVVGDQSSGKSSVLESLTDFSFPRAPGLCTRYVTQITCRRDSVAGVDISIIPGPGSSEAREEELGWFKRSLNVEDLDLADVFDEANEVMGIRMNEDDDESEDEDSLLTTFSEDILKIEISGPDRQHLTVIDVPGIFRNSTDTRTTDEDIELVNSMVKRYIKDERTIILAVIPCNQDIATQEILNLAKEVDPRGQRTLGVLTKPDLAPESAMQRKICDLVEGRRHPLHLGYYLVKNRGSDDDDDASLQDRRRSEAKFFGKDPWLELMGTSRVGTPALLKALTNLLRALTKSEFRNVVSEVEKLLQCRMEATEALGPDRADPASQRRFLGRISAEFQDVARCAREAQYGKDIFRKRPGMKLITLICELNDKFSSLCWQAGHSQNFIRREYSEDTEQDLKDLAEPKTDWHRHPDLCNILDRVTFDPSGREERDLLMDTIVATYKDCRGPEIGTFNPALIGLIFKEQSKKWEPLILRHASRAIVLVHDFVTQALLTLCPDHDIRERVWNHLLRDEILAAYEKAMGQARFLIEVERDGVPVTVNRLLDQKLEDSRRRRQDATQYRSSPDCNTILPTRNENLISRAIQKHGANDKPELYWEIHDAVEAYYSIALTRVIDSVCQQVVFHFLLNSKQGPLSVFSPDLVMSLGDEQLQEIASEDCFVRDKRERLGREVEKLQKAVKELRVAM